MLSKRQVLKELVDACLQVHLVRTNRAIARCMKRRETKKKCLQLQSEILKHVAKDRPRLPMVGSPGNINIPVGIPRPPLPTAIPVPVAAPVPHPVPAHVPVQPIPGPVQPIPGPVQPVPGGRLGSPNHYQLGVLDFKWGGFQYPSRVTLDTYQTPSLNRCCLEPPLDAPVRGRRQHRPRPRPYHGRHLCVAAESVFPARYPFKGRP